MDISLYQITKQEGYEEGYNQGRADAINEFLSNLMNLEHSKYYTENNVMDKLYFEEDIKQIAKQLKEKKE